MGHLKFTVTTLLLAFFTITSQNFNFQSQAITIENAEQSVNLTSVMLSPLAIAKVYNRGSGR